MNECVFCTSYTHHVRLFMSMFFSYVTWLSILFYLNLFFFFQIHHVLLKCLHCCGGRQRHSKSFTYNKTAETDQTDSYAFSLPRTHHLGGVGENRQHLVRKVAGSIPGRKKLVTSFRYVGLG